LNAEEETYRGEGVPGLARIYGMPEESVRTVLADYYKNGKTSEEIANKMG